MFKLYSLALVNRGISFAYIGLTSAVIINLRSCAHDMQEEKKVNLVCDLLIRSHSLLNCLYVY